MSEHRIIRITRNTRSNLVYSVVIATLFALWPLRSHTLSSPPIFFVLFSAFSALCMIWLAHGFGSHRSQRLSSPPGWKLLRFAELCFSKKTFTHVLEPALSDMQKEHLEALAGGRPWQARMALVRGYWSYWSAVIAQLPISLARRVYEVWKATKTGT
jgi:hypothetical protein